MPNNTNTTFIYALCDPDSGRVRYVGKSNDPESRLKSHKNEVGANRKCRWIQSLLSSGKSPVLTVIAEVPRDSWQEHERRWIAYYRGIYSDLTNHCDGGYGRSGLTDEEKIAISEMAKKRWATPGYREKIFTEERRRNLSIALTGKKKTAEHVSKLPQNQKGYRHSKEFCEKVSRGLTGRKYKRVAPVSPETRKKLSDRMIGNKYTLGRKLSDDHKKAIGDYFRGRMKSDDQIAKMRMARRWWWKRKKDAAAGPPKIWLWD